MRDKQAHCVSKVIAAYDKGNTYLQQSNVSSTTISGTSPGFFKMKAANQFIKALVKLDGINEALIDPDRPDVIDKLTTIRQACRSELDKLNRAGDAHAHNHP